MEKEGKRVREGERREDMIGKRHEFRQESSVRKSRVRRIWTIDDYLFGVG